MSTKPRGIRDATKNQETVTARQEDTRVTLTEEVDPPTPQEGIRDDPHQQEELIEHRLISRAEHKEKQEIIKLYDASWEWETQLQWNYAGHGEWFPQDDGITGNQDTEVKSLERETDTAIKWITKLDQDVRIHTEVLQRGYPNRWGARIPVHSQLEPGTAGQSTPRV